MVIRVAEKNTARGRAMIKTDSTVLRPRWSKKAGASPRWLPEFSVKRCRAEKETPMDRTESAAVAREAVRTRKNLPSTRCIREMGLERMVSIVPRSFSPAEKNAVLWKPFFRAPSRDPKSTRLKSRHSQISYAVFCIKKKK